MTRLRSSSLARAALVCAIGAVALALAACGGDDDDGDSSQATPTPGSGPGAITIQAGAAITGRTDRLLVVSASPQAGGAQVAEACAQITSAKFSMKDTVMTDVKPGAAPCSSQGARFAFPEGTYVLTFAIYAPPARSPEAQATSTVKVAGDVSVKLDGAAISK